MTRIEIRDTAETLIEDRGLYGAKQFVRAALKAGNDPKGFWSRVWDEIHMLTRSDTGRAHND